MCREWFRKQMSFYSNDKGRRLYALGPLEITLIVVAVILVFGVGKLSQVGGALGKSLREFRKEREGTEDVPKLTTKDTKEESSSQPAAKTTEENKN